jgi:hypothetical protein
MAKAGHKAWWNLGLEAWSLGVEASQVIVMRTAKVAMGGDADGRESRLMVSEKLAAVIEMQTALVTGALGANPAAATSKVIMHYRRKVRANRRRLSA